MRIVDLYGKGLVLSFEIFPPRTEKGEENLFSELGILSLYRPGFISVTYGAGGSTRGKTLDLALKIREVHRILPLVHFTCVGFGRGEVREYLREVQSRGLENILALRGDPPQGEEKFTPPSDGFTYANELVEFVRSIDGFTIGVAGYPEGHPEAPDLEMDIINLKRKVDAGADFIITQLFYDNRAFYNFTERVRKIGITVPIIPGIMPVTNWAQIEKSTKMSGAKIPAELMKRLQDCHDQEALCRVGVEFSVKQCEELLSWGIPGIHFYPLNKAQSVREILDALNLNGGNYALI